MITLGGKPMTDDDLIRFANAEWMTEAKPLATADLERIGRDLIEGNQDQNVNEDCRDLLAAFLESLRQLALIQQDLRYLMRGVGMPDVARPESPQQVFHEAVGKVLEMRELLKFFADECEHVSRQGDLVCPDGDNCGVEWDKSHKPKCLVLRAKELVGK